MFFSILPLFDNCPVNMAASSIVSSEIDLGVAAEQDVLSNSALNGVSSRALDAQLDLVSPDKVDDDTAVLSMDICSSSMDKRSLSSDDSVGEFTSVPYKKNR